MQNFQNLEVYKLSKRLSVDIFKEIENIQTYFRIKEQLVCAANSICSNLAEMAAYDAVGAHRQKIMTCIGEANEVEHDLDLLHETGKLDMAKHREFVERIRTIRKMLFSLLKSMGWESKKV